MNQIDIIRCLRRDNNLSYEDKKSNLGDNDPATNSALFFPRTRFFFFAEYE